MRALALLMFVSVTLPIAFVRPIVGLLLWIMFSYMNPHRIAYGFATSFNWVMIVALVTIFSTFIHDKERQPLRMTPVMIAMTLFLLWTGLSTLNAVEAAAAQAKFIEFFKILLMAYFTLILVTDRQRLHWVLWTIVVAFGFWGLKGGVFTLVTGGGYHVMGPIKSFFRDNNDFALVMCMTIPLMRYLQLQDPRRWIRLAGWGLMGFTALSILGTQSRGGFLALGVTGLMLIYKSRRRAGLVLVVPLLVVGLAAVMPASWYSRIDTINDYQQDKSAQGRIDSWKFATNVAIANPLLGGGFIVSSNRSMWARYGPPGAEPRAVHSIFFDVLSEHGFVGLFLFISMLVTCWFSLARIRKRSRDGPDTAWMGDLANMMQVSLVAYAGAGSLLPMPYFDLFYQMLAITGVLNVLLERAFQQQAEGNTTVGVAKHESTARASESPEPASRQIGRGRLKPQKGGVQDLPRW